ncbi:MAG TPA: hypothetical protein DEZ08_04705 [Dehalococcoidia bacterium]|jgi:UDP-glucose 4-epimerase|nr:hypothetical protein [Dehalococcoidia bacterium]
MSIMVTGGTGFIGWRIIRKLLDAGEKVVCFDLSPPKSNLDPYKDKISFYRGDVTQLSQIIAAINTYKVNKIIHMAALLPPDTEDRPQYGMFVNIDGTNNIFEAARWTGIKRVVYASSIAVYGIQDTFGQRPLTEEDLTDPINVYGFTKAANDFSARIYSEKFGVDIKSVRISTVFGHGRVTGMTGMIGGLMISLPAIGQPVSMEFSPTEASPMIHAEDAAEIFVRVAVGTGLKHNIYLTGGHLATIGEIANIVKTYIPDAVINTGSKAVPHVYLVDNSKMLSDIGYEMPPLTMRILQHINDARLEHGLEPIKG